MPGFDGSGPTGAGPMTGKGHGYCALPAEKLPRQHLPKTAFGFRQASFLKEQLRQVETRLGEINSNKDK